MLILTSRPSFACRTSAALADRAAAGPDKELVKQWKAMGVKVDKNGNPISRASTARAGKGSGKAAATEPPAPKKKLFGLF